MGESVDSRKQFDILFEILDSFEKSEKIKQHIEDFNVSQLKRL